MSDVHGRDKGSWGWALRVAERTALVTVAALFMILHSAELDSVVYRRGMILSAVLLLTTVAMFRGVFPRLRHDRRVAWLGALAGILASIAIFATLRGHVPSAHLFFLPPIVMAGLLADRVVASAAGAVSAIGYVLVGQVTGSPPSVAATLLNSTIFVFAGAISGMLSQELRDHYRREQLEHRTALAVGHRLTAVVGAIEEAIVFSNRQGMVRLVNRRAAELFGLDPVEQMDTPVVQLLRIVARQTEDPEGFMERFQELRDDPESELDWSVEQIIPTRRVLQVLSRPVKSATGVLVGRIDVYTDNTAATRRATELESAYEQARKTAESYQRGLLPKSAPSLPRVGLVAHYIAAAGEKAVCGDFYDFLTLSDGRVGVVLGDVTGIGPDAVNDAALVRYTIRSLVKLESDPGKLLEMTNDHVQDALGTERFVRVVLATLDPERALLEYANAGHVPPLLLRTKRGNLDWLGEGGLPLGVEDGARYKTAGLELDPGDMLMFYTDGVTEAPRKGKPFGQGRLSDLVRMYGAGTPGELVQAVRRAVEGWVDEELRDDLAMVGVQVVPDTAVESSTRELVLPNEPSRIREVRDFVAGFLADLRVPVEISAEILLASSEATGNAVKYGRRAEGRSEIRVLCSLEGTDVLVEVADDGPGFDFAALDPGGLPDPFASGGRGLFLMKQMCDTAVFESTPQGTNILLRRRAFDSPPLPAPAEAGAERS
jgi:serine phosphatase RsbU (regulator of sigma subunit)/anti-sigma regulatory factor (Ser/Thr protein kinase)